MSVKELTKVEEILRENPNALNDEQIIEISKFLEDNMSEDAKKVASFPSNNGILNNVDDNEISEVVADVDVDPETGVHAIRENSINISEASISDVMDYDTNELDIRNIKLREESYDSFKKSSGFSDEDSLQLLNVIMRYRSGEKFNLFNSLPAAAQGMIRKTCIELGNSSRNVLNMFAKEMVEGYIRDMYIDQEVIDFQESLKRELDLPSISEMYQSYQKDLMEESILKKAEEIKESHPDKAEKLIKISEAFKNSYTFNNLKKALTDNKKLKLRSSDLNAYIRYCNEFNFKYEKSKLMINDISIIGPILGRKLKDSSLTDIEKFVVTLCKFTAFMSPNVIEEHTFMYYTIKNIMALDYIEDSSEFSQMLINNILEVIELINKLGIK